MKKLWALFSLIPLVAFSQSKSFSIEKQAEKALSQLDLVDEEIRLELSSLSKSDDPYHNDSLLFEIDEELEGLEDADLPWIPEKIGRKEITNYLEERVKTSCKKQEEDFTSDISDLEKVPYEPSLEVIPKRTAKLFQRPKVIESKESKNKEMQAKSSSETKQKKLFEIKEKSKILTNRNVQKKRGSKVILKSEEPKISD